MNRSAKERWILAAIAITLLVMFFLLLFSVSTMPDGSMQRMGVIPKNDEVKKGDVILALRWFRRDSIKTGDLLVVKVFTNSTLLHVVRRVAKIELPEAAPTHAVGGGRNGAIGREIARHIRDMDNQPQFVLMANDGSNQDALLASQIAGKVVHVFRHRE